MAEALAVQHGLSVAAQIGLNSVLVESDVVEVIEACSGGQQWWDEAAAIYANCVDLGREIGRVKLQDCFREANNVAHEIAKDCYYSKIACNWVDEPEIHLGTLCQARTLLIAKPKIHLGHLVVCGLLVVVHNSVQFNFVFENI